MSSEDSANYSDAHSGYDLSGDSSPIPSGTSNADVLEFHPKQSSASGASVFRRSESLFLVLLFALIAFLLPAFFFYASSPSTRNEPDGSTVAEARKSPLTTLLTYIPTISTLFRLAFSASYTLFRPFVVLFSFVLALFAPIFIAANVLFKIVVLLPSRIVTGVVQFFYPVYLFCGTACILGGVVGLGGKLLIEGGRLMLERTRDETIIQREKIRHR